MAKFNYKFESIKQVKIALEKKVQKEINVLELKIKAVEQEIENLINQKVEHKKNMMSRKSLKVAELKFLADFEKVIDEKVKTAEVEKKKIKIEIDKKQKELEQKSKETKMFEKLEEKHKLEHMRKETKKEQLEIDDIATKKYIRGN